MYPRSGTSTKKWTRFLSDDRQRLAPLSTLMPRRGSYDLNQFFPLSREREKAAIGISAGFITQPGGNEPRNPGRGGIASLVPASPCASLRRKLPGRPFPRVYHVVKGTSCRSSREGERERERASRRRFISRQYRGRRGRSPFVPRRNGAIPARRNVIPIATMITFNRVEHAIIGIGN